MYGAHVGEGSLTQYIASAFQDNIRKSVLPAEAGSEQRAYIRSIILDGEMLVWDPSLEKYLAFGTLKTAALGEWGLSTDHAVEADTVLDKAGDDTAPRPCCKLFDLRRDKADSLTSQDL